MMEETQDDLVNRALQAQATLYRRLRRDAMPAWFWRDLSMAQVRMLLLVTQHCPATVSTLAQALGIGVSTASHLVDKLVRSELAERSENPQDRRQTLVRLTTQGEELLEQIFQDRLSQLRLWVTKLDEAELRALVIGFEALARVAERVEE